MKSVIRKVVTFDEDIHIEGSKTADSVLRIFAVATVVKNPWAGRITASLIGTKI